LVACIAGAKKYYKFDYPLLYQWQLIFIGGSNILGSLHCIKCWHFIIARNLPSTTKPENTGKIKDKERARHS
jgi:hypothetical protein